MRWGDVVLDVVEGAQEAIVLRKDLREEENDREGVVEKGGRKEVRLASLRRCSSR